MEEYLMPFSLWKKVAHKVSPSPYYDTWTINKYLRDHYGLREITRDEKPGIIWNGVVHFRYEVMDPKLITKFLLEWG